MRRRYSDYDGPIPKDLAESIEKDIEEYKNLKKKMTAPERWS